MALLLIKQDNKTDGRQMVLPQRNRRIQTKMTPTQICPAWGLNPGSPASSFLGMTHCAEEKMRQFIGLSMCLCIPSWTQ
jgi:hypothetical protein